MKVVYTLVGLAVLLWSVPEDAPGNERQHERTVTVAGTGNVRAVPDSVQFLVGATVTDASAASALRDNNAIVRRLREVLTDYQIPDQEVQTVRFSVSPEYKPRRAAEAGAELVGYRVDHVLKIGSRERERVGEILDRLVVAGANLLQGVEFSVAEPDALFLEALNLAVREARAKAQTLTASAGVRLGPLLSIVEGSRGPAYPVARGAMELSMASSVPVAAGEQEFSASVTLTYAIE